MKGRKKLGNMNDVSIIIPVFNAENHIKETLNSIEKQQFNGKIEAILINDGSEDNSVNEIENFISKSTKKNITYRLFNDGFNKGQGARRNYGIDVATGEAIIFLDSDDLLTKEALRIAYDRLKGTIENDFVIFEWAYYYPESGETIYVNKERYHNKKVLYRETCEMLLTCLTYFSVNKMYKKEFLQKHNIRYGEGYIYEDFVFYVRAALKANRVPVIPNILYKVRVHDQSTTKTDSDSLKHRDSFLAAIEDASKELHQGYKHKFTPYHVNKYFIYRTMLYGERRLPNNQKIRDEFIRSSMVIINRYSPNIATPNKILPFYDYAFNKGIVKDLDVKKLKKIYRLHKENKLNFYQSRELEKKLKLQKFKNDLSNNFYLKPLIYNARRKVHSKRANKKKKEIESYMSKDIKKKTILMLGFDYSFTGNSKYLFEYLKSKYTPDFLKIATFDINVPEEYRVEPRSKEFFDLFYSSHIIIAESWIPLAFRKKEGQTWIQLWHGSPFKKMLFDTNEIKMISLNSNHKVQQKRDIARWDYLLSDSKVGKEKLTTSFDIEESKILNSGYPRNQWLIDNYKDEKLIRDLKIKNNIPLDKKVILYAPTWRDYNYKVAEKNKKKNYMTDFSKLINNLGDDYVIINKAHSMDSQPSWNLGIKNVITVNNHINTQELIVASDVIITDYSSIFFDAIHIRKPFYFLMKDFPDFDLVRGVYNDMYRDFLPLTSRDEISLSRKIKSSAFDSYDIPEKYKNDRLNLTNKLLYEFIDSIK
ncbi:bifunctional glycosyltransferase/CDP-glycerol:glycerophosphate glycerophosphotransferase [Staphylococcus equorum]|uniref:Bifunctional glycosyltransferase family 2 protein/CDP-glycerol:glycerophosphate glycerophosphotransferase n=1 Tax=Staphylococcus equorum TaxID=246432 RepID=A0A9X4LBB4_9STAP|nr:CDP-glycerol glycerophosphotransferase family protein [Staphylococcus equorum]MDG0860375.1 bifunctional glycosyltransferase family 2 protein/CDP-glycerol:glycerophosphate glycerophosphotransferase [Staphylococcus equorum]